MFLNNSVREASHRRSRMSAVAKLLAAGGLMSMMLWAMALHADTANDLIFIHHSCGANWLSSGLDAALVAKDYIDERNDMYYGCDISPDAGRPDSLGSIPGDNTNMNHWIPWFNDYLGNLKTYGCATGVNKIVMFKSCYPISDVGSDGSAPGNPFSSTQSLANYKAVYRNAAGSGTPYTNGGYSYLALEDVFAANPDTLFIPVTAPPLTFSGTDDDNAHRARLFNNWLKGDWFNSYNAAHPGLNNVAVFDWFDVLANPDDDPLHPNRLKEAYGGAGGDADPNSAAHAYSTQVFATNPINFLDDAPLMMSSLPGDFNFDGAINGLDYDIWKANVGMTSGATFRMGDANRDGAVDELDLDLWKENAGSPPVGGASTNGVPEPGSLAMLAGVALTAQAFIYLRFKRTS
jgi:hypothetical protein